MTLRNTLLGLAAVAAFPVNVAAAILLNGAGQFAVLAGSSVSNVGASVIRGGHVGTSPGSSIVGFPPGTVMPPSTLQTANAFASGAQNDLTAAYTAAAALTPTADLTGLDLGGRTLAPGVYRFSSTAQLTGILTLDYVGNPDAEFVFQIGSTLTSADASSVLIINGGAAPNSNVFWQIGSSATLGAGSAFQGHLLALTDITLNAGATLDGSALSRNGTVNLNGNSITRGGIVPEPAAMTGALLVLALFPRRRRGAHVRGAALTPRRPALIGG